MAGLEKHNGQDFNNSANNLSSAGKNIGKQALNHHAKPLKKKMAKKVGKGIKAGAKAGAKAISSLVSSIGAGLSGTVAVPITLVIIISATIPMSLINSEHLYDNGKEAIKSNVEKAIDESYSNAVLSNGTRDMVIHNLNAEYGCGADGSNVSYNEDGSLNVNTETCSITVSFSDTGEDIATRVSAYTSAVNSTISQLSDELYKDNPNVVKDEEGNIEKYELPDDLPEYSNANYIKNTGEYDEHGTPIYEMNEDTEEKVKAEFDNEYLNASGEDFADRIKKESSSFFEVEGELAYWRNNTIASYETTTKEKVCIRVEDGKEVDMQYCSTDAESIEYEISKVEKTTTGYKGSVVVPIYFDITDFRKDDLEKIKEDVFGKKVCALEKGTTKCDTKQKVDTLVRTLINDYYRNGLMQLGKKTSAIPFSSRGMNAGFTDMESFNLEAFLDNIDNSKYYSFASDGVNGSYNVCAVDNNKGWPYSDCAGLSTSRSWNKMICSSYASSRYWEVNYPDENYPLPSNWDNQLTFGSYSTVDTSKIVTDVDTPIPQALMGISLAGGGLHALFIESVGEDGSVIVSECNWSGNMDSAWNETEMIASSYAGRRDQSAVYGFKIKKYSSLRQCLIEHGNARLIYMYGS